MLTVKPLSCINILWLEVHIGYRLEYVRYVIVVTWARGICLICMPKARGLRAYISCDISSTIISASFGGGSSCNLNDTAISRITYYATLAAMPKFENATFLKSRI